MVDRSDLQWRRLAAFLVGSGLALGLLWRSPFDSLSAPIAAAACSIPVTLWFYGLGERSWKSMLLIGAGVAVGVGVGTAVDGAALL